jgi:fluoride exporter
MDNTWWWIFLGGAIGTVIRYWVSYVVFRENEIEFFPFNLEADIFPWATLLVNVVASFVVGLVAAAPDEVIGEGTRTTLLTGFCGGLSTFSTFSQQIFLMLLAGAVLAALFDILISLVLGIAAVILGLRLGYWLWLPT